METLWQLWMKKETIENFKKALEWWMKGQEDILIKLFSIKQWYLIVQSAKNK